MIVIVSIGTVIFKTVYLILSKLIYDYDIEMLAYIFYTIKEVCYIVIVTFVIFKPITLLAEIINKSKDNYYLL